MGKIARDVALLGQTEIQEAIEPSADAGGSSTMPHKRNPVRAARVLAAAVRAPGLVSAMLSAMPQEHERGLGGWQAEWDVLPELVRVTASAATSTADLLERLIVRTEAMERNLQMTQGLIMAESVVMALAPHVGKSTAHGLVDRAARRALDEGSASRTPSRRIRKSPGRSVQGRSRTHSSPRTISVSRRSSSRAFLAATDSKTQSMTNRQTLQTTSRGIAWRADGPVDAPALLLLGSLGTTSDIWRPQIQPLSARYRVIRLDTRGHGQSDATAGTVALDDLGADAVSVLDAAGVERVAVCGVSLGGMTAMWLAAHVPDRVRSLVAVSTG